MEIQTPTWDSKTQSYTFRVAKPTLTLQQTLYLENQSELTLPDIPQDQSQPFVHEFLEKTKKYFTNPLTPEKVLRHLRHAVPLLRQSALPSHSNWYIVVWQPVSFTLKAGEYTLTWEPISFEETHPLIPAEFTGATTPRAQSPAPEQQEETLRSIQIHDSLIPVGDLPLSDLPPLSFEVEDQDPAREESRRRIREARLKVQLAKLKAQRMEQRYFERYGAAAEDSEESSEFSSSEEEDQTSF
jgi:hypothetical protein